jgi:hypothetical protein
VNKQPDPDSSPTLSLPRLIWRMVIAVTIWLVANLVTFLAVSFLIFMILGSLGVAEDEELFSLAVMCAIPAALTVSSLIAGRKLIYLAMQRYREKR